MNLDKDEYFKYKYIKYKEKYLQLKEYLEGGGKCPNIELKYIDLTNRQNNGIGIQKESRIYHPNLDQSPKYALQFTYTASGIENDCKNIDRPSTYDGIFSISSTTNSTTGISIIDMGDTISLEFMEGAVFPFHRISNSFIGRNTIRTHVYVRSLLRGKKFFFKKSNDSFTCSDIQTKLVIEQDKSELQRHLECAALLKRLNTTKPKPTPELKPELKPEPSRSQTLPTVSTAPTVSALAALGASVAGVPIRMNTTPPQPSIINPQTASAFRNMLAPVMPGAVQARSTPETVKGPVQLKAQSQADVLRIIRQNEAEHALERAKLAQLRATHAETNALFGTAYNTLNNLKPQVAESLPATSQSVPAITPSVPAITPSVPATAISREEKLRRIAASRAASRAARASQTQFIPSPSPSAPSTLLRHSSEPSSSSAQSTLLRRPSISTLPSSSAPTSTLLNRHPSIASISRRLAIVPGRSSPTINSNISSL